MAIVQDEISLVKVSNGEDGKDTYIQKAWSWSADGTDRFTTEYPNENLFVKKEVNNLAPFATGTIGENPNYRGWFYPVVENEVFSLSRISPFSDSFGYYFTENEPKANDSWFGGNIYNTDNPVNGIKVPSKANFIVLYLSNSGYSNEKLNIKLEKNNKATIYTPSPKDDFDNAWPKYEGYYSSHNPVQSTNPSDYTWSVIRGENGKDGTNGTDGKDGVTPKDVISGYLSNESIIVPATPTGTVTDYSKAFGDFIVFEGQTQKTSGVTYSKVSEVGMTSSINNNGRYVVSALSADTGTVTYRATYSGVTIDKIMIVVKNKQGPSGTNGTDGKDGSQGPQGVPGKDGSNGKDGATGPQGPPTGITTSASVPSNPYVNMLWQNTGTNNGYITGVTYQWNGQKWNIFIFTAENIIANSLSAISANLGTITAGEILTSFFRGDSISSAIKKRGTTIISDGQFKSSFDYVQVTNNTILGKGDVTLDENGFMVRDLTTSDETMRSTSYTPEGIFMTDDNLSFGTVALKYQDLMTLPDVQVTASQGFEAYSLSGNNQPVASRQGRYVELTGAMKNIVDLAQAATARIGTLPVGYRPMKEINRIVQGTGASIFLLTVKPNGDVFLERYRDHTGYRICYAGSWLNIACGYVAGDI
ncbi:collagen-like protein [Vagococcus fluvialis]|uniref:collagen-like protein n=1 Tax=Vagococcus fluvialis TaxID=2738 RepID=UPI001D0AA96A|nr:collagen-like protein [Vagococcus fluvialis]UDM75061.1 collagen-like protein [Vagococcus fluvialis]